MGKHRELRNSILFGLLLTALSLALHFAPVWVNMLNRGAQTWDGRPLPYSSVEESINEHRNGPEVAFTRRPLMTWSVDALSAAGLHPEHAFVALGFGLFFLAGLLVHRVARQSGSTPARALLAQVCFHLSPTVLFAWFDPMYTYDEPIQYVALLLAMLAALRGSAWWSMVCFAIALIAREPSLLLAPGFALLLAPKDRWKSIAPILAYTVFLLWWMQGDWMFGASLLDLQERPSFLHFNFSDARIGAESVCYLTLVLALPVFLLARFHRSRACTAEDRRLLRAFWITLVLNTIAVLVAAKAREARLFALPLIFGWPLMGKALTSEFGRYTSVRSFFAFLSSPLLALQFVGGAVVISIGITRLFNLSTGIGADNLFHETLIAELLVILACLYADKHRRSHLRAA